MTHTRTIALLFLLLGAATAQAGGVNALETPPEGWQISLPGRAVRQVVLNEDWSDAAKLVFTVRVSPAPQPAKPLRVMVSLIAGDDWWYQSSELVSIPGEKAQQVVLDLGHLSGSWTPCGHLRAWDGYVRQRVRSIAVSIYSPVPYAGVVNIGSVALEHAAGGEADLSLYDAEVVTDAPRAGETLELGFRLTAAYRNPFDRGLVTVTLNEGGKEIASVPAFFYQDYRRRSDGTLKPVGAPCWRARLVPPKAGRFRWAVRANKGETAARFDCGEVAVGPAQALPATAASVPCADEMTPFVLPRRVTPRASVFALGEGKWRLVEEEHKEPLVRAWRVPLEWTGQWGRYGGLGRYNLENAWRFDDLIRKAETAGLSLPLALNADEPFEGQGTFNWFSNPLSKEMGGPLAAPSAYFTDRATEEYLRRQVEYLGARWASSRAVSRFELWMSVPANQAESWHERVGGFLASAPLAKKAVVSRHPQGAALGTRRPVNGFEREWGSWQAEGRISPSTRIEWATDTASEGARSLKALAPYPGEAAVYSQVTESWAGSSRLVFDVYVPKDAPNDMRAMVYVRERDWWWYETLLDPLLRPGDWTKLIVDISPGSGIWTARGHKRTWDGYVAQGVREMGIRIFGDRKYDGPVYIDNIELWPDPNWPPPVRVTDLVANAPKVGQYEKFEVSFRLSRVFANPFDPREADVRGVFVSPAGRRTEVPAFFYQAYSRRLTDEVEQLTAEGASCWKVRFASGETGAWKCFLKVNGTELTKDAPIPFEIVRSDNPGFVRRSALDPQYFEFTNGKFFYPIGHTLRSPSDGREPYQYNFQLPEAKGTYIYDDYFTSMAQAGETLARIWMCSWWCGLEWNKQWRGFGGVGVYNMENGWRLDYLVEQATRHGIYLSLDTTNHGQFSIDIDHEWENNPFNSANGGFLDNARDFFSSEKAKQKYEDRMRYTIARWGYSPTIMQWTIFSEVEFVEEYWQYSRQDSSTGSPNVVAWHSAAAKYIKATDPFGHLVTTHLSHPWRGHDIWAKEDLEIIQSNAYSKYPELGQLDVVETLSKVYHDKLKQFGRPVLIAEYGGHWMTNTKEVLDAELHSGLWAMAMMPYSGNTGFWWWLHVHFANKYSFYLALANYMKGEDRRGKGLVQGNYLVTSPGDVLKAVGLQNKTSANVWVYHQQVTNSLARIPAIQRATLGLAGFTDGTYRIEFWDTYKGVKSGETTVRCSGGQMTVKLPVVQNDIALKVALEENGDASSSPK